MSSGLPPMDKRGKILVAHHDETIHSAIRNDLVKEGFEVEVVQTGAEAVEKAKIQSYIVAIIDHNLPDMNYVHLLGVMKQTAPKMRKIVIVSEIQPGPAGEIATAEFVVKSSDLRQLLKSIRDRVLNVPTVYEEKVISEFAESEMMDSESRRDL